jgi:hypothetical protein
VKAFAKFNDGSVRFLKDGYTDFIGKFSYGETNSMKLNNIKRISLLVKSDELGSVKREVNPPENINNGDEIVTKRAQRKRG